jgi:hypothetical protein
VIFNDYKKIELMIKEELLINTGLALGAIALAPSFALNQKRGQGIQLWTLRDTLPKDVKVF